MEIEFTESQLVVYGPLINAAIGFFLGLVQLGFGYIRKKLKLGVIGIISATVGGAIAGVFLSIPAMAIFTWLVIRDRVIPDETVEPSVADDDI
ncbi:hypothetical protein BH24ACI3_BH24ACI3_02050 [soil metagenome]